MTQDPYYEGLIKICQLYRENKETVRGMIGKSEIVTTVLVTMYYYLAGLGEIDPIDSTREGKANYVINIL